jgi:hypothetical protein
LTKILIWFVPGKDVLLTSLWPPFCFDVEIFIPFHFITIFQKIEFFNIEKELPVNSFVTNGITFSVVCMPSLAIRR